MSKIPNWSREDNVYPKWVHDETGDSIEIGPEQQTEYHKDGTPARYQITFWARDGRNNLVADWGFTSLEQAKEKARELARKNTDGKLVRTMNEEYNNLDWGEESTLTE